MRFAHLADTHLGYRQYNLDEREEDFYAVFDEAVDRIIDAGCEFVLHSGDLFDEARPHVKALVRVREALERLSDAGIKFYCIAGNHDMLMRRGAVPPQKLYREVEFLTPAKPFRVHGDVFIAGLPYFSKIHRRVLLEKLSQLEREAERYETRVLALHQGIRKYFDLEYEVDLVDLPQNFHYYAMGHIHKKIVDAFGEGVLAYPGSTEIWRSDEIGEYERSGKGFFVIDTEDISPESIERVTLEKVRPFRRVEIEQVEEIYELAKSLEDGKSVLRIDVRCPPHEFQRIYHRILAGLGEKALYIDVKKRSSGGEAKTKGVSRVSVEQLIRESMSEHTSTEQELAVELFRLLARGGVKEAQQVAQGFFERIYSPQRMQQSQPVSKEQLRLEGFR
ncbi:metallophosphoesterase family protein [Candidatus Pyrohabitans sp.]